MKLPLAFICGLAAMNVGAQIKAVTTKERAFIVMPAEIVCQSQVRAAEWSTSGNFLFLTSISKPAANIRSDLGLSKSPKLPEVAHYYIWNRKARKSTEILGLPRSDNVGITWLHGDRYAYLTCAQDSLTANPNEESRFRSLLYRLDLSTLSIESVLQVEHSLHLLPNPINEQAILSVESEPHSLLTATGKRGLVLNFSGVFNYQWSIQGDLIGARQRVENGKPAKGFQSIKINPLDGQQTLLTEEPVAYDPDKAPPQALLSLLRTGVKHSLGGKSAVRYDLWLLGEQESDEPRQFIAADASEAELSPTFGDLYFQTDGVGFVRQLDSISLDEYKKVVAAKSKEAAIEAAKQVAVSIQLYSADSDDMLPMNDDNFYDSIYPYLRNDDMLRSFHYTFGGNLDISKAGDTSQIELGYVSGAGGKAVAYADGHVIWRPDKPESFAFLPSGPSLYQEKVGNGTHFAISYP